MSEELGEIIFLRYAFPVIGYCNSRVDVEPKELAHFVKVLRMGQGQVDRGRLEKLFPNAVPLLKSWGSEDVRDYWLGVDVYNNFVGDNFGCRTYLGKALEIFMPAEEEVCQVKVVGLEGVPIKSYVKDGYNR